MLRKKSNMHPQPDVAQRVDGIVRSSRAIMRQDMGLSTDIERLPLLTWIMFLKFLDDREGVLEAESAVRGERHIATIRTPYRWRDWAKGKNARSGDDLLAFVKQDDAALPDGKRGPGLLAYLRELSGGNGTARRRRIIASIFKGVTCPMTDGYLLREVIEKVDGIHFDDSQEICILGRTYEKMLLEMRNAAGQNGEFYTPRPVVKFMVQAVNPKLGETVLDPACGTGGFLVEAYQHLQKQCQKTEHRKTLQHKSIFGGEAKPLPYLLGQMNLLLHGLDSPAIDPENSLRFKLTEIGDKDRYDIILTNPPFGGEETKGILANFPVGMQTAETALLFLQIIMRKIKRLGAGTNISGRAAIIVPNGVLFGGGVGERVRRQMLDEFNLHTVVRLPNGVFSPYTGIPTNILFFDRSGPTRDIWFYEIPLPEGRKNYTKMRSIQFEEFQPCLAWWESRRQNGRAWKISAKKIKELPNWNLDIKNPRGREMLSHLPPEEIALRILQKGKGIAELLSGKISRGKDSAKKFLPKVKLGEVLRVRGETPSAEDVALGKLRIVAKIGFNDGQIEFRESSETRTGLILIRPGDLLISGINAAKGAIAVYSKSNTLPAAATIHYSAYEIIKERCDMTYLHWFLRSPTFQTILAEALPGGIKTEIKPNRFLSIEIPLPPLPEQRELVAQMEKVREIKALSQESVTEADSLIAAILNRAIKGGL